MVTGPCMDNKKNDVPCEPRDLWSFDLFIGSSNETVMASVAETLTVEDLLSEGLRGAGASPTHLAVRGNASASSIRCNWRGIARSAAQREQAIRYWLGLDAGDTLPAASYVETLFEASLDVVRPLFVDTAKSNFAAIARGGLSTEYLFLTCYADFTAQEYILGAGPTTLTLAYDRMGEAHSYPLYRREHDAGFLGSEPLKMKGAYQDFLDETVRDAESELSDIVADRESVVFLAPMGAHNAIAIEAWQVVEQWDLQFGDDGTTVNAVRYGTYEGDPEHSQTLVNLKSRVTAAATTDDFADDRIANVSGLNQYYQDIGAYSDITPDDGSTATFTPAQPPPMMTCASGSAVTSPSDNRGLVHDCEYLLAANDSLRGTGSLNWDVGTAIGSWDGITTSGTPTRVTKLELDSESLTGVIPSELGPLFELTHLKLNSNSLTGSIPRELGWLYNLEEIKLSGNSLTGCIPIALEDVATNDLSSLNLLYCWPPSPESLSATQTETSIALNWGAVSNTTKYRVEYREALPIEWIIDSETVTTAIHTFGEVDCGTSYQFRVSAFGSGTTYDAEWSLPSQILNADTDECVTPVFDEDEYGFTVSTSTSLNTVLGTVTATDPNDDSITYSITAGNTGAQFAINRSNGEITLARSLSDSASVSYSLTVQATDGANNVSTTVEITVSGPETSLHGLPNSMVVFDQVWFNVGAQHLNPARTYSIQMTTDDTGIVLHNTRCSTSSPGFTMPAGSEDYSRTVALHACAVPGGTITATLMEGTTTVATATWDVTVTVPTIPRLPSVEILDPPTSIEEGQRSGFRVRAFYLVLTDSYTVRVTADNANLGFDNTCTDRQDDSMVDVGDASTTVALDLYACAIPSGTVTATLLRGATIVDTATWDVTVTEQPPTPSVEITGLASTLAEGQNDAFEVVASHLTTNSFFYIEVATDGANLGFNSDCSDRYEDEQVALNSETGTLSLTLYACSTTGGTVAATLIKGSRTVDSLAVDVAVVEPPEDPPTAPQNLGVTLSDDSFSLSWDALTGAANYEPQYRTGDSDDDWIELPTVTDTSATFSPTDGPACGTAYTFRVRAYGDGTFFVASWGTPSATDSVETDACNVLPEFEPDSYTFSVAENATTGTSIGSVTATDEDVDDELSYSIINGNTGDVFDIAETTGAITVAGALDHETIATYTLTVEVDDGRDGTDSATVTITVTDVPENTPPAPENLDVSLANGTFSLSWDALSGAANYEPQYRTGDSDDDWIELPTVTDTNTTFSPTNGPTCGTTYTFRVRAYGDAIRYIADWGTPSATNSVTTDACNIPPEFDPASYSFSVAENAAIGASVDTVSATDENVDDVLSYSITSGNTNDAFDINPTSGEIMVNGALNYETTWSYTLTVKATDRSGLTMAATVTVTVIAVPREGELELWSGTLTAARMRIGIVDAFGYTSGVMSSDFTTTEHGTLRDATFEYGGETYTIELAAYVHAYGGGELFFIGLDEKLLPTDTKLVAYLNGHRLSTWRTTGINMVDTHYYYAHAFRFAIVDGQEVALSLYKANPSNDSRLSSLALSVGMLTPTFDAGITSYAVTVSSDMNSVSLTAEAASEHATVAVSPSAADNPNTDAIEINLATGQTTVVVTVTAGDGSTTDYTVTVTREST